MARLQRQGVSEHPVRFTPRGLVDALDSTDKFEGACIVLKDLVFDQSNPELMAARPGVGSPLTSFAGFNTPGVVSVQATIGNITYGMIQTTTNPGKDEPFAWDNANNVFLPISGITNANTPQTPASTGPWTPPTIANVGVNVIVTHPGFPGGATKFGWFNITNPAAPVWNGGDCTTSPLSGTPTSVSNFNNRAYFSVGNTTQFTDVLSLNRTASTQSLTIGDASAITAQSGLPIQTTSSGAVQALLVFKPFQIWQITGDSASGTLSQNYLSLTIGTSAPRTVWQVPSGVYFVAVGGPYIIDTFGIVRPVVHSAQSLEPDIQAPFENAVVPSRAAGAYTASIYRVCLETVIRGVDSVNDYWFDEHRRRWTGPHSFSFDCASQFGNYLIINSNGDPGKLFKSQVIPDLTSVYNDDGITIMTSLQSSTFPKEGSMTQKQVIESTIELSNAGAATTYTIAAQDDQQNTLSQAQIQVANSGVLWGSNVWGDGSRWNSSTNRPRVYNVPWTLPVVFQKMALLVQATATSALSIGTFFARYQQTGYTNVPNP
jgi:hypothetical protein